MRKITRLEPKKTALPTRKKVAAYARVSKDTERLLHSASAQVSYYSELIQKNKRRGFSVPGNAVRTGGILTRSR